MTFVSEAALAGGRRHEYLSITASRFLHGFVAGIQAFTDAVLAGHRPRCQVPCSAATS